MDEMKRYAVYYAPRPGPFADRAASWLGWDAARGATVPHPSWPDITLDGLTAEPRRYGFHGTLRAPFRARPRCVGRSDRVHRRSPRRPAGAGPL